MCACHLGHQVYPLGGSARQITCVLGFAVWDLGSVTRDCMSGSIVGRLGISVTGVELPGISTL